MSTVIEEERDDLQMGDLAQTDDHEQDERRAQAERMGWADKEHWRGDPDQWVDHEEFLRRGEERLPVLQERLRKQDQQMAGLQKELRQVIQTQGEWRRQETERVQKEFDERKRRAVSEADTDAYDRVSKEEEEYRRSMSDAASAPSVDPDFEAWHEKNNWYGDGGHQGMTRYANRMGRIILEDQPELKGTADFYDEVEQAVRARYPDHFTNPRRERGAAVASAQGGPGGAGGGAKRKKVYSDMPADARAKCDEYVAAGWVANREEYVATYFSQFEDGR